LPEIAGKQFDRAQSASKSFGAGSPGRWKVNLCNPQLDRQS